MPMTLPATQASNLADDPELDNFVNAEAGVNSKHGLKLIPPVGDILIRTIPILTHCKDINSVRTVRHISQG